MCSCNPSAPNLCECHCGTRLDLNPTLLSQKQHWKSKCTQLELQYKENLKNLREKIYKECSTVMEVEFRAKEEGFKEVEKKRVAEYQGLYEKWLGVEPRMNALVEENGYLRGEIERLKGEVREGEERYEREKRFWQSDMKEIVQRHGEELDLVEKEKEEEFEGERKEFSGEIYHLRHQIADFEAKYRQILPELERLKHTLHTKTNEVVDLRSRLSDESRLLRPDPFSQTTPPRRLRSPQTTLEFEFRTLQRELQQKNKQLQKLKSTKDIVKTEIKTVYVEKPVEVEVIREVERIVEVEKIVKEYVEPKQPIVVNEIQCGGDRREEEYDELVVEINNRTRYIAELQNELAERIRECEEYRGVGEELERNIEKYKAERLNLAQTITNKNREIEALEGRVGMLMGQVQGQGQGGRMADKIVVNVKKDGTYSSNLERGGGVATGGATRKK